MEIVGNLYRENHEGERELLRDGIELSAALRLVAELDAKTRELETLEPDDIAAIPKHTYLGAYDSAIFVTPDGGEYTLYDGVAEFLPKDQPDESSYVLEQDDPMVQSKLK